jgi:hypothetical protein
LTTTTRSEDSRWLADTACRLPCWEGITPGTSTSAETLDRLKQLPFVGQASATQAAPTMGVIRWTWKGSQEESGLAYYVIESSGSDQPILSLNIKPSQPIPLREIVAQYGEPSHILAGFIPQPTLMNQSGYLLTLYFKKYNFQAIWLAQGSDAPSLNEDTHIHLITITDPRRDSLVATDDQALKNQGILPWSGFRDFHEYCMNLMYGGRCQK